jgi:hypothetical protein
MIYGMSAKFVCFLIVQIISPSLGRSGLSTSLSSFSIILD